MAVFFAIFCTVSLPLTVPQMAHAQSSRDNAFLTKIPPSERIPRTLRPQGLVYKGFVYSPSLSIEEKYDSNILTQEDNELSDFVTVIRPGLSVRKEYNGHVFQLDSQANIERYAAREEENKQGFDIRFRGLFDLNSRWSVPFTIARTNRDRTRSEPTEALTAEPLNIDIFDASIGIDRQFNRLKLGLRGDYRDIEFEDGTVLDTSGGASPAIAVFSDGNRREIDASITAQYDIPRGKIGDEAAEHSVFVTANYGRSLFDDREFIAGPGPNGGDFTGASGTSTNTGIMVGFATKYKGLVDARLGIGYENRNFDDDNLADINNLDFDLDIDYFITPKFTLRAQADRFVDQDNGFANGVTRSQFLIGGDYELRHDIYAQSHIAYKEFEFEGLNRDDDEIEFGLGLRYLNTQNIHSEIEALYQERSSSDPREEFDRLIFLLRLNSAL